MKRKLPDIETLKELHFNKKMSGREIAALYNCSAGTVYGYFQKYRIRMIYHSIKDLNFENIKNLYFNKKMSFREIAKEYKIGQTTVIRLFRKEKQKSRTSTEAHSLRSYHLDITPEIMEFLNGLLLGDGCIKYTKGKKSCTYEHADKNRSYIRWLKRIFKELGIFSGPIRFIKINPGVTGVLDLGVIQL